MQKRKTHTPFLKLTASAAACYYCSKPKTKTAKRKNVKRAKKSAVHGCSAPAFKCHFGNNHGKRRSERERISISLSAKSAISSFFFLLKEAASKQLKAFACVTNIYCQWQEWNGKEWRGIGRKAKMIKSVNNPSVQYSVYSVMVSSVRNFYSPPSPHFKTVLVQNNLLSLHTQSRSNPAHCCNTHAQS